MKQIRPGFQQKELCVKAFAPDRRLCPVSALTQYKERTKDIRIGTKLFVSFIKPYSGVSRDTIARWLKLVMKSAGIDLNTFSPHSTRAAATSAAEAANVPIGTELF